VENEQEQSQAKLRISRLNLELPWERGGEQEKEEEYRSDEMEEISISETTTAL